MAGKSQSKSKNELQAPVWLSALLLAFAALLLYAIKNPVLLHELEASLQLKKAEPSLVIRIPVSNVAVAATIQSVVAEQSM